MKFNIGTYGENTIKYSYLKPLDILTVNFDECSLDSALPNVYSF
jgi:hypothetical protein